MKLSQVKVDVVAIEQGQWVDDLPGMGDLRLKVRGSSNADWRNLFNKMVGAVPREKIRGNKIDPKEMDRIFATCLHKAALLDWDNLTDGPDEDHQTKVPYSSEMALKLLTAPEYVDFYQATLFAANVVGRDSAISEEVVKN